MKEKAFMGYTIKGIDEDRIPKGYSSNKSNIVYLLLEAVESDDFCVIPDTNSELREIWVEYFNQSAPGWGEEFKNAPEQSTHPLSEIEYYEYENYKALKVCNINCSAVEYWSRRLKELMRQVNQSMSIEILNIKDFKAAAEGINSRCFTGS